MNPDAKIASVFKNPAVGSSPGKNLAPRIVARLPKR
jgi:hypothetical protein